MDRIHMAAIHPQDMKLKILIIGSLPPPIGGTTVLLKQLIDELSAEENIEIRITNTSEIRGAGVMGVARLAQTMFRIIIETFKVDVISAHLGNAPFKHVGLFILLIARLAGKPVIFRKFGGSYFNLGKLGDWAAWFTVRRADLSLFETHKLVRLAQERGIPHATWYSNSRPTLDSTKPNAVTERKCKRFVYVGHVKKVKGIIELIEAAECLPEHASVDVYGPITDNLSEKIFLGEHRIVYHGAVPSEKVPSILMQYDALVLPTYHPSEGYPGVVIEAYMCGLPVICTRWQALPEIVDDTTGILIHPGDAEALYQAMRRLIEDDDLYQHLRHGAALKAKEFDSRVWTKRFVDYCRTVAHAGTIIVNH